MKKTIKFISHNQFIIYKISSSNILMHIHKIENLQIHFNDFYIIQMPIILKHLKILNNNSKLQTIQLKL